MNTDKPNPELLFQWHAFTPALAARDTQRNGLNSTERNIIFTSNDWNFRHDAKLRSVLAKREKEVE